MEMASVGSVVRVAEDAVDSELVAAGRERDWAAGLLMLPRIFVAIGFVFASNSYTCSVANERGRTSLASLSESWYFSLFSDTVCQILV